MVDWKVYEISVCQNFGRFIEDEESEVHSCTMYICGKKPRNVPNMHVIIPAFKNVSDFICLLFLVVLSIATLYHRQQGKRTRCITE